MEFILNAMEVQETLRLPALMDLSKLNTVWEILFFPMSWKYRYLSLALLNAQIHNSEGSFRLGSAGGSIRATGLTITGNSSFSSGMGSIKISLARTPAADLYVGSSFNKAQVSFKGHPVTGYFEFIARADEGKIISPFKFDKEETFLDDIKNYRDSSDFGKKSEYRRKSFIRGDSKPKITLKTVTGTAQLIK